MNENYTHPAMPEGAEEGIRKGLYKLQTVGSDKKKRVQLLGSGTIMQQVLEAATILGEEYGVQCDVFSTTSCNELARDGQDTDRWNRLHPSQTPRAAYVSTVLEKDIPVVAATDYMKAYPEQLRAYVPASYTVLGTDGYGRSDSRAALRTHFEVSAPHIVLAALESLKTQGFVNDSTLENVIEKYKINTEKTNPLSS